MRELAIEGIDGSGKSTVASLLAKQLNAEGITSGVYAPYRMANALLGFDIAVLLGGNSSEVAQAAEVMEGALHDINQDAQKRNLDLTIYDRHWLTGAVAVSVCGHNGPRKIWEEEILPVDTAVLTVSPQVAIARKAAEGDSDINKEWMSEDILEHEQSRFLNIARQNTEHVLGIYRSDNVSAGDIVKNIIWDLHIRR